LNGEGSLNIIYGGLNSSGVEMAKRKFIKKVCLLGDGEVGKTSLVRRFVLDMFSDEYIKSFGTKVTKKVLEMEDMNLTLMIWDVLGQKASSLHEAYYKGANGALLVCDLTREETVDSLARWRDDLFSVTGEVPIVLVANKSDLDWVVNRDRLSEVEETLGADLTITSARTGEGMEEAFTALGREIVGGSA
jgi:small GTP-binding protein